jgi:hypothetical protein
MKKFHTWSILIGVALLGALVWTIGPEALWRDITLLGWGLVPLVLIEGVADIFHTLGWSHCLSGPHRRLSFWRIFGIRMAGTSMNYLTPTASLGGEVTKGTLLSLHHHGAEAATAVIIGKLSYALAQLIFVVAGSVVILYGVDLPVGVWIAVLGGSSVLGAGIIGFLLVQKYGKLGAVIRWAVSRKVGGRALKNAAEGITQVDQSLKVFYREQPRDLPLSMLWHIAGLTCGIVQSWYFLYLLTGQSSLLMGAGVWFLGSWLDLMSFAVPFNIGVLEATRVAVFRVLGFQSALGLTFGVSLRIEQMFWAGVGLLIYLGLLSEQRRKEVPTPNVTAEGKP